MPTLQTDRLILREWTIDDFEDFVAMSAEEVMSFLAADGKPLTRHGAWRALTGIVGHWALRGFGTFAVTERATGRFAGYVGP